MKRYVPALLVLCSALMTAAALAHHGQGELDPAKRTTFTGKITKVEWQNPHCWFYMDVKEEKSGKTLNYGFEMGPPHLLQGQPIPITKDSLKIGAEYTVVGIPYRNAPLRVAASSVTPKGGRRLGTYTTDE